MAGKTRVHELAKELGVAPKMVIDQLEGLGYKEQTSASAIDDSLLPQLREALSDRAAEYARKEVERLEAERLAAQRARAEALKAAAAKAARTRARKAAEAAGKPKAPARGGAKKAPGKAVPPPVVKVRPAPPAPLKVEPRPEEKPVKLPEVAVTETAAQGAVQAPPVVPAAAPETAERPAAPAERPTPAVEKPAAPAPVRPLRPREPAAPAAREAAPAEPSRREPVRPAEKAEPRAEPPREASRPAEDGKVVPIRPRREEPAAPAAPAPGREPGRVAAPAAAATERPAAEPVAAPPAEKPAPPAAAPAAAAEPAAREVIRLPETVTVAELAERLRRKPAELIRELVGMRVMATINQPLDAEKAKAVAARFGVDVEMRAPESREPVEEEIDPSQLEPRSPVVTVMGHVDHGKTSLLDAIRKTRVTEQEHGGITQHIGAYQVETSHGKVTFLDTPGHEAFTAMRARGAQATDIVILVVAADDGVMPQTVEAINHARAANVPIIVAVNKVDKADANPDRVKQELTNHGLVPEDWGGQTIFVNTSAKKGTGVDQLLEMTALQAEIMELKANPNRAARGVVVEAKLDRGRGPVATVLIQQGTLHEGDIVVAGQHHGRVRAMFNDRRQRVKSGGPVDPVEVLGLSGVPSAGDTLLAVDEERKARQIALARQEQEKKVTVSARVTLADLHKQIEAGEVKELRVILKGDVHGSVEALQDALERLSTDEVKVRVIHGGVGSITETDVMLASASNAIVIGFNVKPEPKAVQQAQVERVDVKSYNVIYEAINDVKAALAGMLSPVIREIALGKAQVRALFPIKNVGTIAGCFVSEGKVTRNAHARVVRNGRSVAEGQVTSLKRFKDDVREVLQGQDCGIGVGSADVQVGDVLELFTTEEVARTL
jgi:translation initiation factor IF-2